MPCLFNSSSFFLCLRLVISSRESAENCYVPNAGFYQDAVFEDPALHSSGLASVSLENNSSPGQMTGITNESTGDTGPAEGSTTILEAEPTAVGNEVNEQINSAMVGLHVGENASGSESNVDDQHQLSVEDVDSLLDKCLLQALHTTIKDKDLPMLGSILW